MLYISSDAKRIHRRQEQGSGLHYLVERLTKSDLNFIVAAEKYLQPSKNVKWSRYRPGVAQRVGTGIALFFHERGTRRGWVVSSTPRPHFTPRKDPVPILQEAGWTPGSVWMGGKSRTHRDSIPDRPANSQSLYRLSYPAHIYSFLVCIKPRIPVSGLHSLYIYLSLSLSVTHTHTHNMAINLCLLDRASLW